MRAARARMAPARMCAGCADRDARAGQDPWRQGPRPGQGLAFNPESLQACPLPASFKRWLCPPAKALRAPGVYRKPLLQLIAAITCSP